jgi:hypothetical protein
MVLLRAAYDSCHAQSFHGASIYAPDIHKLVAFERGMWGCYTGNRFEQDYHYTKDEKGYSKLRRRADRKNIPVVNVRVGSSKTVDEAGFQLYVSNEDKYKSEIEALGLEEIYHDCILHQHPKDNTKMKIACRGTRGNRGPNLGYTGGQAYEHNLKSKITKPPKVKGTQRYATASKNMTHLHNKMSEDLGFDTFLNEEPCYPSRLDDFARTIDEDNIFEQMGYLYLVHGDDDDLSFKDLLEIHADWETDTHWNFLTCAWT